MKIGQSHAPQHEHPRPAGETIALPFHTGDLYPLGGILIIAGYVLMAAI